MISAFGVEHGISKGFVKLRPKLAAARSDRAHFMPGADMDAKLRHHYTVQRTIAGDLGPTEQKQARGRKVAAQGMLDSISRNNRKKRVLP